MKYIMKTFLSILVLVLLSGCYSQEQRESSLAYAVSKIDGLSDCKSSIITTKGMHDLYVIRCPNSSTSTEYKQGKSTYIKTITVDGVKYEEKK